MIEVQFHALAHGGDAVGKTPEGKTVFAPFAMPGERALVKIIEEKKSFSRAQIVEVVEASPHRIAPLCPFFRPKAGEKSCGGCTWQHIDLETQRASKVTIVRELLARFAGIDVAFKIEGGEGFGYRNKAVFGVAGAQIGFHAHASHHLVEVNECPIQQPENNQTLRALHNAMSTEFAGAFSKILARVSTSGERIVGLYGGDFKRAVLFAQRLQKNAALSGVFWCSSEGKQRILWGQTEFLECAQELQFRVDAAGFWQINAQVAPLIARAALEMAPVCKSSKVLDLYCGAGFFALHFARAGAKVWGVELAPLAVENARKNALLNGVEKERAHFEVGDAAKMARRYAPGFFDVVILDPPRAGAREAVPALLLLAPQTLIYVSCDPATLARDVKLLTPQFEVKEGRVFDMFPQTAHLETILHLEKRAG